MNPTALFSARPSIAVPSRGYGTQRAEGGRSVRLILACFLDIAAAVPAVLGHAGAVRRCRDRAGACHSLSPAAIGHTSPTLTPFAEHAWLAHGTNTAAVSSGGYTRKTETCVCVPGTEIGAGLDGGATGDRIAPDSPAIPPRITTAVTMAAASAVIATTATGRRWIRQGRPQRRTAGRGPGRPGPADHPARQRGGPGGTHRRDAPRTRLAAQRPRPVGRGTRPRPVRTGTAPNELTAADDRDEWAGTRGTSTYRPGSNPADPTRGHR
jgi:hypothetical protein